LSSRYPWSYTELDHSNFDLRIFIDRTAAYISIRLTAQSLMHRSYKTLSKPGSLRPTVAAAMVYLATQYRKGLSVVDDFCGSGTILCEAIAAGYRVSGGDIDPESVRITLSNLKNAGFQGEPQVRVLDAIKTRWPDASFDCAISNPPWGKQIELQSIATLFEGSIKEYARIVKPGGLVCVLTPRPEPLIKYARKHMKGCRVTTVPVSFTGQSPAIIMIER
jgi:tRNA (guanine6-N2)-methyltransferase